MSTAGATGPDQADAVLRSLLATGRVRSLYQPVAELVSGAVVGYEALACGPDGSRLSSPEALFAQARASNLLPELDNACRASAIAGARAAHLDGRWTLFVNTEPATAHTALLEPVGALTTGSGAELECGVIIELTERSLTTSPVELLHLVERIRTRGWGIALDDVGVDRASLALIPLLRPDVIKLDLRLIQQRPTAEIAEIVGAVNAEAERAGSIVLAEGIETDEHLLTARALGASLGQGWIFGQPAPLPAPLPPFIGTQIAIVEHAAVQRAGTPFELGAAHREPQIAHLPLMIELSKHLERQALRAGRSAVLVATFQDVTKFGSSARAAYAELGSAAAFVAVLGRGISDHPLPGVRGARLADDDPLIDEWDIAVVGPHYAATLVAKELSPTGADPQRQFSFTFSHDRDLAIAVAQYLMSKVQPTAEGLLHG